MTSGMETARIQRSGFCQPNRSKTAGVNSRASTAV